MTLSEAIELNNFDNSLVLKEIVENEYEELVPSSSPTEDQACPIYLTPPANPTISLSFSAGNESLPNNFTYMLWIGVGGKMWMQVFSPTSPNNSTNVITHVIPHGLLLDSNNFKTWTIGISHNAEVPVDVRVCAYGWNNETVYPLGDTPNTVGTIEFTHPFPFGQVLDSTTNYYTEEWCTIRFHTQATKTANPGSAVANASWSVGQNYATAWTAPFINNTAPTGQYNNYLECYPLMSADKVGDTSTIFAYIHRNNLYNITEGFGALTAANFSGTTSTTFNGSTLSVPIVSIGSNCSFSE